jgi:hypothetical protein
MIPDLGLVVRKGERTGDPVLDDGSEIQLDWALDATSPPRLCVAGASDAVRLPFRHPDA